MEQVATIIGAMLNAIYSVIGNFGWSIIILSLIIKGIAMGIWRILRCNPFSKGGYDPVK